MIKMRKKIANFLVWLAWKVHPENKHAIRFMREQMLDAMVHGKVITRIDPESMYMEKNDV